MGMKRPRGGVNTRGPTQEVYAPMHSQDTIYSETFTAYLWAHTDQTSHPDGCWLWLLARDKNGYGLVKHQRRMRRAHRVAWEVANGVAIPTGLWVLHRCNRPSCINPAHLYVGNAQANADDREAAGHTRRGDNHDSRLHPERRPRGERHPHVKLTEATVLEIRRAAAAGEGTNGALATRFGVTLSTIQSIVSGHTWAYLGPAVSTEHLREARRMAHARGEHGGNSKLTEAAVREMRRRYADGERKLARLARAFGVDPSTVKDIVTHQTWRHVS